ncbi:metal ABC transporter permease [Methanocrinis sp.]|uniref:metal ABC transporter permease n=1 Tax=Methanocrinis sp. TaxID=3101522 RepID=UPI003D0C0634
MIEIFTYEFMQRALLAGIIASVLCGVIGVYVILNRIVFIGGGIAHTAFGGIGLGYLVGRDPLIFAVLFSVAAALGIGAISDKSRVSEDTAIGVFWAAGMSLGIVFVSVSHGYAPDLFDYLFGNILAVSWSDLLLISVLTLAMLLLVALLYQDLLILSFDPGYGEAVGLPVRELHLLLLCMVALSVVVLIKIVGIILVIALLTIPGAIVRQHSQSLKRIMALAVLLGASFVLAGLTISYQLNIPSGATIILAASGTFFLSTLLAR